MEQSQADDLLTVKEAAAVLKVSPITISRYLKSGRLRSYQVGPRNIRIRRSDLQEVLKPTKGKEVEAMREEGRQTPLTKEEVEKQETAMREAAALRDRILSRRAGEQLPSSSELITKSRQERSAKL
jgi:excisionase family DNA binding protein